jgi:hypothetical protein
MVNRNNPHYGIVGVANSRLNRSAKAAVAAAPGLNSYAASVAAFINVRRFAVQVRSVIYGGSQMCGTQVLVTCRKADLSVAHTTTEG